MTKGSFCAPRRIQLLLIMPSFNKYLTDSQEETKELHLETFSFETPDSRMRSQLLSSERGVSRAESQVMNKRKQWVGGAGTWNTSDSYPTDLILSPEIGEWLRVKQFSLAEMGICPVLLHQHMFIIIMKCLPVSLAMCYWCNLLTSQHFLQADKQKYTFTIWGFLSEFWKQILPKLQQPFLKSQRRTFILA